MRALSALLAGTILMFVGLILLPPVLAQGSVTLQVTTPFPNRSGIVIINGQPHVTDFEGVVRVPISLGARTTVTVASEIPVGPVVPGFASGERKAFSGWSDFERSSSRSFIAINDTINLVADYHTEFFLQLESEVGHPQGVGWYKAGSLALISVDSPIYAKPDERKALRGWAGDIQSTDPTVTFVMDNAKLVTAVWVDEFRLTIDTMYGSVTGEGWYENGTSARIEISSSSVTSEPSVRTVFTGWSGDTTNSSTGISILMDGPKSVTANWKTQYYLRIENDQRSVDKGSQWVDDGTDLTISANTPVINSPGASRIVFTGWSGASNSTESSVSITMDTFKTLTANWKTQFMLDVKDTTGTVTGGGWHDENAIVTLVANQNVEREEVGGRRIKSLFQSWSGSASGEELRITISVDAPKQISANWEEEFYLKINSEIGRTSGEGWYKSGETAVFSARSTPGVLIREVVETWTGDIQTQSASGTIIMDGPKVITATWRTDYTPLFLVVGLIIAAGVVPAFLLRGRKKIPAETVSPKKSSKSKAKKK